MLDPFTEIGVPDPPPMLGFFNCHLGDAPDDVVGCSRQPFSKAWYIPGSSLVLEQVYSVRVKALQSLPPNVLMLKTAPEDTVLFQKW